MDGMTVPAGVVDLGDGPAPFCMRDGDAQRIGDAARASRAAARDPAAREATAETLLRRKRGDVVALLWADGKLTMPQVDAANEVLRVFSAITGGVAGRVVASYAEREAKGLATESLPPSLHAAYVERYVPWRAWAGRMMVAGRHTLGDLVLLFVVDNLGPRQVETSLGMRNGTAAGLLQRGLEQYAYGAGWVKAPPIFLVRG